MDGILHCGIPLVSVYCIRSHATTIPYATACGVGYKYEGGMRTRYALKLAVCTVFLSKLFTSPLCGQWQEMSTLPDPNTRIVVAIDSQTCFLAKSLSRGRHEGYPVYVTRDAGASWETLMDSVISIDLGEPEFITVLRGCNLYGTIYARVLQSRDTGRSWEELNTVAFKALGGLTGSIHAYNNQRAFLFNSSVLATIQRHDTIPEITSHVWDYLWGCARFGRTFWFFSNYGLYRSTDDGRSKEIVFDRDAVHSYAVLDENIAWAFSHNYALLLTKDGGGSWQEIPTPRPNRYHDIMDHALYASGDTNQIPWLKVCGIHYTSNGDGTWDQLRLIPGYPDGFQSVSRCADGSTWCVCGQSVFQTHGTPHQQQELSVRDLSSQSGKRANVILPHIGYEAWQEVIVERAENSGAFEEIGRLRSPEFVFTDETFRSRGPFRYRVTFTPPAGGYAQLESKPITLNRDSVLIIDLVEYLRTPEKTTLVYTNGLSVYCTYDSTTFQYIYHYEYANRDTSSARLTIGRHPDLLLREYPGNITRGSMLNTSSTDVDEFDWTKGQRFLITEFPPEHRIDTITMRMASGTLQVEEHYTAVLVRDLGIVEIGYRWYNHHTHQSGGETVKLAHILDSQGPPSVPVSAEIKTVFPNPSTGAAHIQIVVEKNGPVALILYDLLGREVASIFKGTLNAGVHEHHFTSGTLPKGIYFIVLRSQENTRMKKLLLW